MLYKIIPYLVLSIFGFYTGKWFGIITFCSIYYFLVKNIKITYTEYTGADSESENYHRGHSSKSDLDKAYEILEISKDTGLGDVKKARNRMIKKYHPDKIDSANTGAKKQANERIVLINHAYELIKRESI